MAREVFGHQELLPRPGRRRSPPSSTATTCSWSRRPAPASRGLPGARGAARGLHAAGVPAARPPAGPGGRPPRGPADPRRPAQLRRDRGRAARRAGAGGPRGAEYLALSPEQLANDGGARPARQVPPEPGGGRRGALRVDVGARLPARLPPARRVSPTSGAPGDGAHRHRRATRAGRHRRAAAPARPRVVVAGFDRANIALGWSGARPRRPGGEVVREALARDGAGIVYAATRRAAEEYAAGLAETGCGAPVYHAGLGTRARAGARRVLVRRRRRGGGHLRVRHGHRQGGRALGAARRGARVAGHVLPGGRSGRPRRRGPRTPCCSTGRRTSASDGSSPRRHPGPRARHRRGAGAGRRPAEVAGSRCRRAPASGPAGSAGS